MHQVIVIGCFLQFFINKLTVVCGGKHQVLYQIKFESADKQLDNPSSYDLLALFGATAHII